MVAPAIAQPVGPNNAVIEQVLASRLGTGYTVAAPKFTDGVLTGCGVEFASLIKDFTYKAGNFVRVDGSFNLMTANNSIGILLKIVVNDLDPQSYKIIPNAPVTAFFVSGNATSRPFLIKQDRETDTPGAIIAIYDAKTFPMLVQSIREGTVTIAFARRKGGADMQVPIDLSVEDTNKEGAKVRSDKSATSFMKCASDLIDAERDRLNKSK